MRNDAPTAALKALKNITRDSAMEEVGSRESWIRIFRLNEILGDGKAICMEQVRIINQLMAENTRLKAELRDQMTKGNMARLANRLPR